MTIRVRASDGSIVEFPDDATEQEIAGAMRQMDQEHDARQRAAPQPQPTRPELNNAQSREVGARALQRDMYRRMDPTGISRVAQPLINMLSDPARRAEMGRSAEGALRDVQQLPNLDWGRVGRDTVASVQQGVRDLPQTIGNVLTHLPQVARAATYGPWEDEERAQQGIDIARVLGEDPTQAAQRANTATGGAAVNAVAPLIGGGSALRTAGAAAALDAPLALSRNSDRPLQERLPNALTEIGSSAAFAGGAQGIANGLPSILPRTQAQQMVQRMDRAGASVDAQGSPASPRGVTPSFATANRGAGASASATNLVADNIFAGAPARGRLRRAAEETRDAVRDVRDAYGRSQGREAAGRRMQTGLERHAGERGIPNPRPGEHPLRVPVREWSVASKANAVFDHVLRPIEGNAAQLAHTQSALSGLLQRADSPLVRAFNADKVMSRFRATVEGLINDAQQGGRGATLRDLRELRRGVREAQGRLRLGPDTVDNAALARVESALTQDIYGAAGPMATDLRRADQYYARSMRRIDGVRRFFDQDNPAASLQQILRAAAPRTENTRLLATLRSALPDDEWRMVAASLIDEMGAPLPGAKGFVAEQGFSVERFATAYRNMTPRARRVLFGSRGGQGGQSAATMRQLADDLDNLAAVSDAQKAVQAGANSSGSATHLQNIGSIGLLVNPGTAGAALMGVIGGVLTGEMLTNPAFVRFLVSAQRRGGGPGGMRSLLARMRDLAARDPAIYPAVAELESQLEARRSPNGPPATGDQASRPQQREPALQ